MLVVGERLASRFSRCISEETVAAPVGHEANHVVDSVWMRAGSEDIRFLCRADQKVRLKFQDRMYKEVVSLLISAEGCESV